MTNDAVVNTRVDKQNKRQEVTGTITCDCTMMEEGPVDLYHCFDQLCFSFKDVFFGISDYERERKEFRFYD